MFYCDDRPQRAHTLAFGTMQLDIEGQGNESLYNNINAACSTHISVFTSARNSCKLGAFIKTGRRSQPMALLFVFGPIDWILFGAKRAMKLKEFLRPTCLVSCASSEMENSEENVYIRFSATVCNCYNDLYIVLCLISFHCLMCICLL